MLLQDLPEEIVSDILAFAIHDAQRPADILCLNRAFYRLAFQCLYRDLFFTSSQQLRQFAATARIPVGFSPQFITISLPGGEDFRDFASMHKMFVACAPSGHLDLQALQFCLNTHSTDPNLRDIETALKLMKCVESSQYPFYNSISDCRMYSPRKFEWTGPDPVLHHFSIAVRTSARLKSPATPTDQRSSR